MHGQQNIKNTKDVVHRLRFFFQHNVSETIFVHHSMCVFVLVWYFANIKSLVNEQYQN